MSSSDGYANRLSSYPHKGKLNLRDDPDSALALLHKSRLLAHRLRSARHAVVHTGAGISTSTGIPDFRGPDGIWTQQRPTATSKSSPPPTKRRRPTVSFEHAIPSLTHLAITALHAAGHVNYVVSQNVDGLHLRSGLPRLVLSELHGNLFMDWCPQCCVETPRDSEATTVGIRPVGRYCSVCKTQLTDKALDWEDALPEPDFGRAKMACSKADLHIVAGTSCQMEPARRLPFRRNIGKRNVALVNLSRTELDDRFGLLIRGECDVVFATIAVTLGLTLKPFERIVTMLASASRVHGASISCQTRLQWDSQFVSRDSPGIHAVVYHSTGTSITAASPGYTAILKNAMDRSVSVLVQTANEELEDARVELVVGSEERVNVVTHRIYAAENARILAGRLVERARDEDVGIDVATQFFMTAKERGRAECVICGERVGHARRDVHFRSCVHKKTQRGVGEGKQKVEEKVQTEVEVIDVDAIDDDAGP